MDLCACLMHDVWEMHITAEAPAFLGLYDVSCMSICFPVRADGSRLVHVVTPVLALTTARQAQLRDTPGILSLRRLSD